MRIYDTTSEAYRGALQDVLYRYDVKCQPRGHNCYELINYQFAVTHPTEESIKTHDPERNVTLGKYQAIEHELYLNGELDAEVWAKKASRFWTGLANPDGTINSNYGYLALQDISCPEGRTPWDWARHCLLVDTDSRQAFVRFSQPRHQWDGNKDQVCTMHMNFLIRNGKLHATTVMRSCDVVRGLAYDMPWFCYLLRRMATDVTVPVGTYTHFCHSLHLYEPDVARAQRMLGEDYVNR